jgi:hypothetical protein
MDEFIHICLHECPGDIEYGNVSPSQGVEATKKEMLQLHERKVMEPKHANKLSPEQK